MATVYVVANSEGPHSAHMSLALAQAEAESDERRIRQHPADYRWDQETSALGLRVWELRVKGLTGRWAKAYRSIHELPLS
ncbi:hypothetical protein ACGF07_25640 [Kitasatospora sp. NPDC048194]|uniref:hypothetical protein n=1 Tax=Kitasatospora sp. NPDC048194 TaxID=3364045 RepID=UPI0037172953